MSTVGKDLPGNPSVILFRCMPHCGQVEAMETYEIRLFRDFCAQCGNQPVPGLESKKVRELFCYLLINHNRPFTREKLADMLWPQSTAAQGKQYLRQILWQLQSALGDSQDGQWLLPAVEADWIRIDLNSAIWIDVAQFEQANLAVQSVEGKDLDETAAELIQNAVCLYRGDLLEDWYQEWCVFERERLQNLYLAMLGKLITYFEENGNHDAGIEYANRLLKMDIAHEQTYRRLMRLYYLAGDRTTALRMYQRCERILKEELDVPPSQLTRRLYQNIRDGHPLASDFQARAITSSRSAFLTKRLRELAQLNRDCIQTQRSLEKEISEINSLISSYLSE